MLFESVRGYRASGNFDILAEDLGTAEHSEAAIADKEVTRMRHLVFDLITASNSIPDIWAGARRHRSG
jgi:hypothetical protein